MRLSPILYDPSNLYDQVTQVIPVLFNRGTIDPHPNLPHLGFFHMQIGGY
jgi:hypothetical protein